MLNTVVALAGALVFIGISLRMADQQGAGLMVHLVLSVVAASILPVLLVCESSRTRRSRRRAVSPHCVLHMNYLEHHEHMPRSYFVKLQDS